jgi:formate hydrogenlyase subunit 3/multisubunit Na+/H+ antiporter MnhD subunit
MNELIILLPIIIPLVGALLVIIVRQLGGAKEGAALLATIFSLVTAIMLYGRELNYSLLWAGFGMEFTLRLYQFSAFILLAVAVFAFLITLYCCSFLRGKSYGTWFYFFLLVSTAMVNGAVLSDNLILMLFFWEGTMATLFGMIAIGGKEAFRTATKAFIIVGICDLCMMFGIGLVWYLTGTLTISKINLPVGSLSSVAFIFLMIGAIAKAGSMPFHSWIPDAAVNAPLPFMAFLPASLEKLLGIYFLTRISLDMFKLDVNSWLSTLLMVIGSITILAAVMMALIQKDYKRLLSYHAISQVGYMILGIGTCLPIGIIGGLFHMINNALYKSCLFLTGGAVEKQAGTTNLEKLGGLALKMPITFICFLVAAVSISGVPPFNGFFSKELVYEGALQRGTIFYLAAVLGSFFTAASFLKLGHAAFLGKISEANKNVKEAAPAMLLPMIVIASICVLFGVYNQFPLDNFIKPILGEQRLAGHEFATNITLIVITVVVLIGALLHHLFAVKITGSGLKSADYIRYAPVFRGIYNRAENKYFDPYDIGLKIVNVITKTAWRLDRAIDWVYEGLTVRAVYLFSNGIRSAHTGNYSLYIVWSLLGAVLVLIVIMKSV